MKIISHDVVANNYFRYYVKLRVRVGFFFYTYKDIVVSKRKQSAWLANIDGLSSIELFLNDIEISDYCDNICK